MFFLNLKKKKKTSFCLFKNAHTLLYLSRDKIRGQFDKNCIKNRATFLLIFKLLYPLINSKCLMLMRKHVKLKLK